MKMWWASSEREMGDEAYLNYLDKISAHETHQGYFSIDKKKDKKARFVESKVDRKTQTSDDADAYDLIMKDEERLLSLDESVRFIFSHSALREGRGQPQRVPNLPPEAPECLRDKKPSGNWAGAAPLCQSAGRADGRECAGQ